MKKRIRGQVIRHNKDGGGTITALDDDGPHSDLYWGYNYTKDVKCNVLLEDLVPGTFVDAEIAAYNRARYEVSDIVVRTQKGE